MSKPKVMVSKSLVFDEAAIKDLITAYAESQGCKVRSIDLTVTTEWHGDQRDGYPTYKFHKAVAICD